MPDVEQRTIARERLQRTVPFTLERAAADTGGGATDGLTLEGHAAVWNSPTLIDSWEGRFYEQIARGAFKKTFSERTPVLQFDHGHHPLIGSIPIGRISTVKEDQTGAYVQARLSDNWLVQPVRDAIAEESINGMSFRFSVVREEWRDPKGALITDPNVLAEAMWGGGSDEPPTRTLRELKVPELGPVVFPAYADTDVGVRSGQTVIDLGRLRQDPAERSKLARALWLAERASTDSGHATNRDTTPPAPAPAAAPITINLTLDPSRSAEDVGQQIAAAIRAAGVRTAPAPDAADNADAEEHTETVSAPEDTDADFGPAAERGTGTETDEPPGAQNAHRSTDAPAADSGHADPAPDAERHADEDDEPPTGHSPAVPDWATNRRLRQVRMDSIRQMTREAAAHRAIYERSISAQEKARAAATTTEG